MAEGVSVFLSGVVSGCVVGGCWMEVISIGVGGVLRIED